MGHNLNLGLARVFLESWWHMPSRLPVDVLHSIVWFVQAFALMLESCTHHLMGLLAFTLSEVSQHQQIKLPDSNHPFRA